MTEYLDFFNIYIMGVIETSFQFYFLAKILKKKIWPPFYFLFAVCAMIVNHFLSVGTIIGLMVLVFLLTVCGTFVCHADFKSFLLYAVLTSEIMLLCFGTVKSLMSLLCPFLPAVFHDADGITVMLTSEAAFLLLTGFCCYMVYRYFSDYTRAEMHQMFLIFIPILMIFIMSEYINSIEFEYVVLEGEAVAGRVIGYWQLLAILLLPYLCSLKDIDICIVLSNALDNAIPACKNLDAGIEKYIHVSGRIQGDFLMMEIENSFHGKGAFKKGKGLLNIKKVAEKYSGAMSIETQENVFVLHVLLIVSQPPEGIP